MTSGKLSENNPSFSSLTSDDLAVDDHEALPDAEKDAHVRPALPGVTGAAPALVAICKH